MTSETKFQKTISEASASVLQHDNFLNQAYTRIESVPDQIPENLHELYEIINVVTKKPMYKAEFKNGKFDGY